MSDGKIHEKFRFTYEFGEYNDDDRVESTLDFNTNGGTIDEVVEKFEQFLRGCGYIFKGELVQVDFSKWSLVEKRDSIFPADGADAWSHGQTAV